MDFKNGKNFAGNRILLTSPMRALIMESNKKEQEGKGHG